MTKRSNGSRRRVVSGAAGVLALMAVVRVARADAPCVDATPLPGEATSGFVKLATSRVAPASPIDKSAIAGWAAGELAKAVCAPADVATWLPATCAPLPAGGDLALVERRLVADAARAPLAIAVRRAGASSADARLPLQGALAVVDALLRDASADALAAALTAAATGCGKQGEAGATDPLALAGELVGAAQKARASKGEPGEAAIAALVKGGKLAEGAAPSAEQQAALTSLTDSLAVLEKAPASAVPSDVQAQVAALVAAANAALTLAVGHPLALPVSLEKLAESAGLPALVDAARRLARDAGAELDELPGAVRDGLDLAARVLAAHDREEVERILRGLVLGLGPWSEPWLVDATLTVPRLSSGELKVGGSALLGYSAKSWGLVGRGSAHEWDTSSGGIRSETTQFGGGGDAWWVRGEGVWRPEVRVGGEASVYDSDVFSGTSFQSETSFVVRGQGLLGLRYEPGETFAAGLWGGGGYQYESYDPLSVPKAGKVTLSQIDQGSLVTSGRARMQWGVVPGWLSLRAQVDAVTYSIHRSQLTIALGAGSATVADASDAARQTDATGRLFLDADVLGVFGFVPGLLVGADYHAVQASGTSTSSLLPVFGAAVRRTAF